MHFLGGKFTKSSHKDDDNSSNCAVPTSQQVIGEADPGVISEGESDDDFAVSSLKISYLQFISQYSHIYYKYIMEFLINGNL